MKAAGSGGVRTALSASSGVMEVLCSVRTRQNPPPISFIIMATQHFCRYLKQRNENRKSNITKTSKDSIFDPRPIVGHVVDKWGTVTVVRG